MLIPRVMKGLEKSITFSLSEVMVKPATARSAFYRERKRDKETQTETERERVEFSKTSSVMSPEQRVNIIIHLSQFKNKCSANTS